MMSTAPAPKKNLPHKKRITKKLKSINQAEDLMQQTKQIHQASQFQQEQPLQSTQSALQYQTQSQPQDLNGFQQQLQAHEIQALHQQQHSQIIQQTKQNESKSPLYTNQMENLMMVQQYPAAVKVEPLNMLQSAQSLFSCELCGSQCSNQFEFFAHLKTHYEPKTTLDCSQKQNDVSKTQKRYISSEFYN